MQDESSKRSGARWGVAGGYVWQCISTFIVLDINTVKRYMRYLNLRSNIRKVSGYRKPKAVIDRLTDYRKRNFEPDGCRMKLYTDTTATNGQNGCNDRPFWLKMTYCSTLRLPAQRLCGD